MDNKFFESNEVPHLIEKYFYLSFEKEDIPFKSVILPIGLTHLLYIPDGNQKIVFKGNETLLTDLMVSGQYFRSYDFSSVSITESIGANFHPTALHKLLNIDVSKLKSRHLPLAQINESFYNKLLPIFKKSKGPEELIQNLNSFFLNSFLHIDKNTKQIDDAINLIREKEGLLNVLDIINEISTSQKTLEVQFKKIVGLTPGRYIRLFRFQQLMRKYYSGDIELKDLIYKYNYYDSSHFAKDFKLFMKQNLKSFLKKDYLLLKSYLNQ